MNDTIHFINGEPVTDEQLEIKLKSVRWLAVATTTAEFVATPNFYDSSLVVKSLATSQHWHVRA
ncbi:MAG: hypothetical protein O6920_07445 [Chloroflexi bacterium]|nr:hypothetical protein [Chloroflexota bacterium]MCZ6788783.1 hypothetical protein [Chloroflexota bacterium]